MRPPRARVSELIDKAMGAWTNHVFPRFMLAVSIGEKNPPTQARFNGALRDPGEVHVDESMKWRVHPALYTELVMKDTIWMALTGQGALIGQSWELLGIHSAHREDGPRQWDFSLRLN